MARWNRLFCALALALAGAAAFADSSLRPFAAEYRGRFSGFKVDMAAELSISGDTAHFRRFSEPRGFARLIRRDGVLECGRFGLGSDGPEPAYYAYVDGKPGKGKSATVAFADGGTTAAATYRGAPAELDVSDGAVDKIVEEQLVASRLAAGDEAFTLRVVDRNEVHNVAYQVLGRETLEAAGASYETIRIERRRGNSSRTTRIWAAPELAYQPVRIQRLKDGKVQGTANLVAFSWRDQARGNVTPVCP